MAQQDQPIPMDQQDQPTAMDQQDQPTATVPQDQPAQTALSVVTVSSEIIRFQPQVTDAQLAVICELVSHTKISRLCCDDTGQIWIAFETCHGPVQNMKSLMQLLAHLMKVFRAAYFQTKEANGTSLSDEALTIQRNAMGLASLYTGMTCRSVWNNRTQLFGPKAEYETTGDFQTPESHIVFMMLRVAVSQKDYANNLHLVRQFKPRSLELSAALSSLATILERLGAINAKSNIDNWLKRFEATDADGAIDSILTAVANFSCYIPRGNHVDPLHTSATELALFDYMSTPQDVTFVNHSGVVKITVPGWEQVSSTFIAVEDIFNIDNGTSIQYLAAYLVRSLTTALMFGICEALDAAKATNQRLSDVETTCCIPTNLLAQLFKELRGLSTMLQYPALLQKRGEKTDVNAPRIVLKELTPLIKQLQKMVAPDLKGESSGSLADGSGANCQSIAILIRYIFGRARRWIRKNAVHVPTVKEADFKLSPLFHVLCDAKRVANATYWLGMNNDLDGSFDGVKAMLDEKMAAYESVVRDNTMNDVDNASAPHGAMQLAMKRTNAELDQLADTMVQ